MRIHKEKEGPVAMGSPIAKASDRFWVSGPLLLLSAGVHAGLLVLLIAWPPQPAERPFRGRPVEITLVGEASAPRDRLSSDQADLPVERQSETQTRPTSPHPGSSAPLQGVPFDPSRVSPSGQPNLSAAEAEAVPRAGGGRTTVDSAPPSSNKVAVATTAGLDVQSEWEQAVLARLEKRKRYPAKAQRTGQQDTVYIQVVVDRLGRVMSSRIYRSQRVALLDAAALDLVKKSSPLPPPPATVEGDRVEFIVPVEYLIRGRL